MARLRCGCKKEYPMIFDQGGFEIGAANAAFHYHTVHGTSDASILMTAKSVGCNMKVFEMAYKLAMRIHAKNSRHFPGSLKEENK